MIGAKVWKYLPLHLEAMGAETKERSGKGRFPVQQCSKMRWLEERSQSKKSLPNCSPGL